MVVGFLVLTVLIHVVNFLKSMQSIESESRAINHKLDAICKKLEIKEGP